MADRNPLTLRQGPIADSQRELRRRIRSLEGGHSMANTSLDAGETMVIEPGAHIEGLPLEDIPVDTTPPPVPLAPALSMSMGAVLVRATGPGMPDDFSHYRVEVGPSWTVDTSPIAHPTGAALLYGKPAGSLSVRLVAVDTTGNASVAGPAATITVVPIETAEQVRDDLDAATQAATARMDGLAQRTTEAEGDLADARARLATAENTLAPLPGDLVDAKTAAQEAADAAIAAEARATEANNRAMTRLANGNFEDGLKYWNAEGGASLTEDSHSGSTAVLLPGSGANLMPESSIPVVQGQIWEIQVYYKALDPQVPGEDSLVVSFGTPGVPYQRVTQHTGPVGEWASTGPVRYTIPEGVDAIRPRVVPRAGTSTRWIVDDIAMRDVTDVVRLEQAAQEARQAGIDAQSKADFVELQLDGIDGRLDTAEQVLIDAGVEGATDLATLDQRLTTAFQQADATVASDAAADATAKANAAQTAAEAAAKLEAEALDATAKAATLTEAAVTAEQKAAAAAATAKAEALTEAAADATAKADQAKADAVSAAAADATAKANAAKSEALSEAAQDAQAKADAARDQAIDAAGKANIYTGEYAPAPDPDGLWLRGGVPYVYVDHEGAGDWINTDTGLANWTISDPTGASTYSNGQIVLRGTAGRSASSPLIPVSGDRALQHVLYKAVDANENYPDGRIHRSVTYYDADGNPVQNSAGYTTNGNAAQVPVGDWAWTRWTLVTGENVAFIRVTVQLSTYTGTEVRILGSSITSGNTIADTDTNMPFDGDTPGFKWDGERWASTSSYAGPGWYPLSDPGIREASASARDAHAAAGEAWAHADLAVQSASGKTRMYRSTEPPSGEGTALGDVWWQFKNSLYAEVVGQWTWNGSGWIKSQLSHETISSVDIGTLTVVGQSTFGTAVADQMFVDMFAANKVTSRQMTITDGNLVDDPTNEGPGWGGDSFASAGSSSFGWDLIYATGLPGRVAHINRPARTVVYNSNVFPIFPEAGGKMPRYLLSARVRNDRDAPAGIRLYYYTESGDSAGVHDHTIPTTPGAEWQTRSVERTAPAGARYGQVAYYAHPATSGSAWIGRPEVIKMSSTVHIEDGAITADKVTVTDELITNLFGANRALIEEELVVEGNLIANNVELIGQTLANDLSVTGRTNMADAWAESFWAEIATFAKVTAGMLTVSPGNLYNDPGFNEQIPNGWTLVNGGIEKTGSGSQSGSYLSSTTEFPVKSGDSYLFEARRTNLEGSTGDAVMFLQRRIASTGAWVYWTLGVTLSAEGVTSNARVVPADTDALRVGWFTQANMPNTTKVRITEPRIVRQVGTTLIEPGSITAEKMNFLSPTVNGRRLRLDSDGILLESSTGTPILRYDQSGLRGFNPSGTETFSFDPVTGKVKAIDGEFSGKITIGSGSPAIPQAQVTGLPEVASNASTALNKITPIVDSSGNVLESKVAGLSVIKSNASTALNKINPIVDSSGNVLESKVAGLSVIKGNASVARTKVDATINSSNKVIGSQVSGTVPAATTATTATSAGSATNATNVTGTVGSSVRLPVSQLKTGVLPTDGKIQTATTGSRVEFNNTGFYAYTGTTQTVAIRSNGTASFKGDIDATGTVSSGSGTDDFEAVLGSESGLPGLHVFKGTARVGSLHGELNGGFPSVRLEANVAGVEGLGLEVYGAVNPSVSLSAGRNPVTGGSGGAIAADKDRAYINAAWTAGSSDYMVSHVSASPSRVQLAGNAFKMIDAKTGDEIGDIQATGPWHTFTLVNSWTNNGTGAPPRARREGNNVRLSGHLKPGNMSLRFADLPSELRPEYQQFLDASIYSSTAQNAWRITVSPSGWMRVDGTLSTSYLSLDGLTFPLD